MIEKEKCMKIINHGMCVLFAGCLFSLNAMEIGQPKASKQTDQRPTKRQKYAEEQSLEDKFQKALRLKNLNSIKKLISASNINEYMPAAGWTPLIYAINYGNYEATEYLLEQGANPNQETIANKFPPLLQALFLYASSEHRTVSMRIMKLLLDKGADLSCTDQDQNSILMRAILMNYAVPKDVCFVVHFLLSYANEKYNELIDKQNNDSNTPLLYAVKTGNRELINLLIQSGANPHIPDKFGKTALKYCIENGFYAPVIIMIHEAYSRNQLKEFNEAINKKSENEISLIDSINTIEPRNFYERNGLPCIKSWLLSPEKHIKNVEGYAEQMSSCNLILDAQWKLLCEKQNRSKNE